MKTLRDPKRKPTHAGAVLREDVLSDLGWTQAELANRLMVSRVRVSDILLEKTGVTAEMAVAFQGQSVAHLKAGFVCRKL